ncbi:MAG: hypothetical protein A3E05_04805, partial [Candidatus Jacksonbacteria bacterium RIFCSPHIGHO2_12_FULL_44_12]
MATTTKYKPYPKMKPAGVDWIGKIPAEWNVEYMKNLGRFESSGIDKKIVEGEPLIQMVNYTDIYGNESRMIDSKRELMTVSCPAWKIPEANLIKGDLVFTPSSETTEDIGLSALISENLKNTVFSYHVIRFRFSKELNNDFKKYLCNNAFVWQQFSRLAKGTTRQILDRNDFKNIFVVIPSVEEQKAISDFLDRETTKIDGVVEKKQKLIELLKEKRQALITHAVTKGLDPKVKMKSSGIDWLGDIPEKWEIWKYGHLFLSSMGETILREDLIDDGKIPVYSATEENVNFGYVDSASVILNKGDLVIPARGNSIGNVKLVDKLSTTTQTTIYSKLIKKSKIDVRYVLYLLAGLKNIYFFFDRTAIPQITVDQVQNNDLCIPSLIEQETIADFLDRETTKIDGIIKKVETQIEKLQEYRQALI